MVFGPGVGECIVLHLGGGEWAIIDSCVDHASAEPVALKYLREIGVDPAFSVKLILATHWHDDHIGGMGRLLEECLSAKFAMSAALATNQFIQLVFKVDGSNPMGAKTSSSSASEFARILEVLRLRSLGVFAIGPDIYGDEGKLLFQGGHQANVQIWALSPSAATVTNAQVNLADKLLTPGNAKRFKNLGENDFSVAAYVQAGRYGLLLGADLHNNPNEHFGWKAVLKSKVRPSDRLHGFKVAHHGSARADHSGIWSELLLEDPIAVVTPFSKLVHPIPKQSDVDRIKSFTSRAYCTTWPHQIKPPKREVDGQTREYARSRQAINPVCGSVRLRINLDDQKAEPTVEVFGSAKKL